MFCEKRQKSAAEEPAIAARAFCVSAMANARRCCAGDSWTKMAGPMLRNRKENQ
jgi:hypothetical protein